MSLLDRRQFLKSTLGTSLATGLVSPRGVRALRADAASAPTAKADTLILLWMAGGMAHSETFDPKRYTPFEAGMKSSEVSSTFPAIETAVDGIQISAGLERIASVLDRGTLIRSHIVPTMGKILHARHQYHWHTGYEPPMTVAAPHLGAWLAKILGPRDPAMPAFIDIGQPYEGNGEAEELKAFQTGGFLGTEFGPFRVPDPQQAVNTVRPPTGMSRERFRARRDIYARMVALQQASNNTADLQRDALLQSLESAYRLLESPASQAFDLSLEPVDSYEKYNTGKFGLGCLLARRLTEAGARFIEVTTEFVPFLGWDNHDNGHTRLVDMKKSIDGPVAQLVLDLEERGLLDRTLIVLASEFSRSMLIEGKADARVPDQIVQPEVIEEPKYYGLHRHFTGAGSVLMFGGGIRKGALYGRTDDEAPFAVVENPITVTDLHATMYHALGISPKFSLDVEQRPFYVTKDGLGKPVLELFA
ncbi:DUF1501 domain-containing protein [Planctomicrobium sp. SH661]|uniref:DUF1501 domain-containing protein n=1 Tax=Planctomicrobium sp. SH661 TaxID=3448124 RepID=UPI003F5BCCDB